MKSRLLIIIGIIGFSLILFSIQDSHAIPIPEISKIEWSQYNYAVINGTGTAKIIVTDTYKNQFSDSIDTLKVFVFSDSFPEGITLTLYETQKNTGIFERVFTFSDKRSAPNILYAIEGDTVHAKYFEDSIFTDSTVDATMFLGLTGPPLERAPTQNLRIIDNFGNSLDNVWVDQQVQITSDVSNGEKHKQKFVFLVMIQDSNGVVDALGWITGVLDEHQGLSPAFSWIPQKAGIYTASVFVWESIENPTALSPPMQTEIIVKTPIPRDPPPGPSDSYKKLYKAQDKIRELYHQNVSLGPYHIQDVIVGFGIKDNVLVINVLTKYYQSEELDFLKEKILDIINDKIPIEFIQSYALIPNSIEIIFPYVWNAYLQQNQIDFSPKERSYGNTDQGYHNQKENKVCSPLIAGNGTEFYISSLFIYEPFEITETIITQTQPKDCQKIWKTDTILVEPDNILRLWLEDYLREK